MRLAVIAIVCALTAAACESAPPAPTPLELQSLQQREFETSKEKAFASVVSVFQDLGYTIESADIDTGFITAASTASTSRGGLLGRGDAYTSQTRATAFVEGVSASLSRVRLNFVDGTMRSTQQGQSSRSDQAILDPAVYQAAFERIANAIFVRS